MMNQVSKSQLRAQMLQELAKLEPEVFKQAGILASQKLESYFDQPVAIFKSFSNEIDTNLLIKRFKSVLLPNSNPELYAQQILNAGIKLVVVPGLAFDLQGHRLGRGGGYYDRCLEILRKEFSKPEIIGLCLREQIISEIPVEPHDQKVDRLICS
ncbi:MAG: 5-formyltetrahydrofolate cyclo-ligase [Myxococcaceae bacterium]